MYSEAVARSENAGDKGGKGRGQVRAGQVSLTHDWKWQVHESRNHQLPLNIIMDYIHVN